MFQTVCILFLVIQAPKVENSCVSVCVYYYFVCMLMVKSLSSAIMLLVFLKRFFLWGDNYSIFRLCQYVGADYICVQSMDGQLSFFVHESFAFAVFLPDFLTPGPLCYLPRTDCIITANSSRQLQCFQSATHSFSLTLSCIQSIVLYWHELSEWFVEWKLRTW